MDASTKKPDLMAASSSKSEGRRILARLEHGARLPAQPGRKSGWTIDGWTIGLAVLLLSMCIMALLVQTRTITPATFRYSPGSARPAGGMLHTPAAVPTASALVAAQPESSVPEADAAAAIVNVGSQPSGDVASSAAANAGTAVPAAMAPARDSATPRSGPAAAAAGLAAAATSPRKPAAAVARAPGANPPGQPAVPADTDVTLLTALVAHANKPTTVAPERSRDVVERQDGDNTTQLLARCKQLGLIEGMLCRSRICAGRWESDAACRAPAH